MIYNSYTNIDFKLTIKQSYNYTETGNKLEKYIRTEFSSIIKGSQYF